MPATFVLRGVRSPRTKASSVTCSTLPPSQAFQSRVSVTTTAAASITTNNGVAYCSHGQRGGALGGTGSGCGVGGWFELGVGAGVLAAAIVSDSFSAQQERLLEDACSRDARRQCVLCCRFGSNQGPGICVCFQALRCIERRN